MNASSPIRDGWLLKCRPSRWDLERYILDGHRSIDTWTINVADPRLAVGDPVLFWVTGTAAATPVPGLWGVGVVAGASHVTAAAEDGYWRTDPTQRRPSLWIPVDVTLLDEPVSRTALEADPRLSSLKILRNPVAGNPQPVTANQLAVIGRYLRAADAKHYGLVAAARAVVADAYRRSGWQVARAQAPGWDLTCSQANQQLRIVVRRHGHVVLTHAQAAAAASDPLWRLIVVDRSGLDEYDGAQALGYAEPVAYRIPGL